MPSSIAFFWVWGGQKGKNISGALVRVLESASRAVKLNQPRVLPFLQRSKGGFSRELGGNDNKKRWKREEGDCGAESFDSDRASWDFSFCIVRIMVSERESKFDLPARSDPNCPLRLFFSPPATLNARPSLVALNERCGRNRAFLFLHCHLLCRRRKEPLDQSAKGGRERLSALEFLSS